MGAVTSAFRSTRRRGLHETRGIDWQVVATAVDGAREKRSVWMEGQMWHEQAWHRVEMDTQEDGTVVAHISTNDDDDDGRPDGRIVRWTVVHKSKASALRQHGVSRIGVSGVEVRVVLDGHEVTEPACEES